MPMQNTGCEKRETCRPDWTLKTFPAWPAAFLFFSKAWTCRTVGTPAAAPRHGRRSATLSSWLTSCGHTTTSADLLPYERPWTLCEGVCQHKLHWHVFDGPS